MSVLAALGLGPGGRGPGLWEKRFLHVTLVMWWLLDPEPGTLGT